MNDERQKGRVGGRAQPTLTQMTADQLRELALSVPEGQLLGTEKELLARFAVSRPTFREAVQIVESERIVVRVRGLAGGIFSRRPDLQGVIAAAATYLRSRETTLGDLLTAANAALTEAVELASGCTDQNLREELATMIGQLSGSLNNQQSVEQFREDEIMSTSLICEMSGNVALDLIIRLLYSMGVSEFHKIFDDREEFMSQRRTSRLLILRAIQARDRNEALRLCQRNSQLSRKRISTLLDLPIKSPMFSEMVSGR